MLSLAQGYFAAAWLGKKRRGLRPKTAALSHKAVEAADPELAALLAKEVGLTKLQLDWEQMQLRL
eukprot:1766057-Amphidinium_carterae.1